MAVVSQSFGSAAAGAASVNVSWPSPHQADDIGILVIESGTTLSTPSGWTLVDSAISLGGLLSSTYVFWKRAASSSESTVNTGFPAGADHVVARIYGFRGCLTTSSPILTSAAATRATGTTWSAPSITTTTASEFVVWCAGRDNDSSSTSSFGTPTNANLISPTELVESGTISGHGGGFTVGYGVKTTAGATGTTTGTVTSSAGASVTFSLAAAPVNYVLTADKGTRSFTGNAATLKRTVLLVSSSGDFIETGNAASLSSGFSLASSAGAFNEDGNNVTFVKITPARTLIASTGTFTETDNAAVLIKTFKLTPADQGTFIETGNAAVLARIYYLIASTGTFTEVGNAAVLAKAFKLTPADRGTFTETGFSAVFVKTGVRKRIIIF